MAETLRELAVALNASFQKSLKLICALSTSAAASSGAALLLKAMAGAYDKGVGQKKPRQCFIDEAWPG